MLISPSRPLSARQVRLEDGREFVLDEAGQFAARLAAGTHSIEVEVDGHWHSHRIDIDDPDSMQVIDLDNETTSPGLVGKTLDGRYRVEEAVAQGGIGVVYRATDLRLERSVAIKTLAHRLRVDDRARALFLERAGDMIALSHPHLAAVEESGVIDDVEALICEFVEGRNLKHWIDDAPLDIDDALVIAYQLSTAIAFIHQHELVHGDLEPASVIIEEHNGAKIIDYGLARLLQNAAAAGVRVHRTPAYMAPEQIHDAQSTEATDVFRLGVLLFELLSAELPADRDRPTKLEAFERDNLVAYAEAPRRSIEAVHGDLPPALVDLVDGCLVEDPAQRPTAEEVADRLAELYQERNDEPPPQTVSPHAMEGQRRRSKERPDSTPDHPLKPAVSDIDPERGVRPEAGDEDQGQLERPVRRIALIIFIVGTLFGLAVLAHLVLSEPPAAEFAPEPESTTAPETE